MGNVLLHLEEGERLDINCTKLLNDEVRIMEVLSIVNTTTRNVET